MSFEFKSYDQYASVLQNGGYDYTNLSSSGLPQKVSMDEWLNAGKKQIQEFMSDTGLEYRNTISTPDISPWLPQVVRTNILEAMEPLMVLTSLFERMDYSAGQIIELPAVGAVVARKINEGDQYPFVRIPEAGGTMTATTGKYGVAFRITDESRRRSEFDIVGQHLRACGRALARLKEEYAAAMITQLGVVAFDNLSPTNSAFGPTTGRGLSGSANGSMVLDDLLDAFLLVMNNGFTPDTVIMNPLTFIMFLKDEVLRSVMLAGGNQVWYGGYTGNPAMTGPGSRTHVSGAQKIVPGGAASGDAASPQSDYNQAITSAPQIPNRWPWPLRIVVSPWIPFDAATKRTDIVVCDGRELGFYIEEYGVQVAEWEDLSRDVTTYRLREGYGFHISNEGLGVATLKNVKMIPNQVVLPAQTSLSVSGSVTEIDKTTAV